jgi:RNA ligase
MATTTESPLGSPPAEIEETKLGLNADHHYVVPHHYYADGLHADPESLVASLEANPCVKRFWDDETGLFGYSYTDITSIKWDPHTEAARGIIFQRQDDGSLTLVALPFPKFHNFGKGPPMTSTTVVHASEKLDGSLGIVFWHVDRWHVCTRGSFPYSLTTGKGSKEALRGLEYLMTNHKPDGLDKAYTYLVEIVAPETRVVVRYDMDGLFLLAAYHTASGYELKHDVLKAHGEAASIPLTKDYSSMSLEDLVASAKSLSGVETEGYVVRFDDGTRRKIKADDYLRLHRSFASFSAEAAWTHMAEGSWGEDVDETLRRFLLVLPDEFHKEARALIEPWMDRVDRLREETTKTLAAFSSVKDVGQAVKAKSVPRYTIQAFLASSMGEGPAQEKNARAYHKALWSTVKL